MKKSDRRLNEILSFIKSEVEKKGYPPSVREICQATGLQSSSSAHGYLLKLEDKGLIRRDPTKPRAIEIIEKKPKAKANNIVLPVIGKVTAGVPITAEENIEDYLALPYSLVKKDTAFVLTVSGESMINVGILDGDYAIVRQQSQIENGEIAVVMTEENEATIKRVFKEKSRYRLQPENNNLQPNYYDSVTILGKVIGIYREM